MSFLLADSGGSKTDWLFYGGKKIKSFRSKSLQPYFVEDGAREEILRTEVLPKVDRTPDGIFFYGAGYASVSNQKKLKALLKAVFKQRSIEVHDDLLAAARATLKDQPGLIAILGTGSNSGVYNGKKIVEHFDSPGFILGDEGSGADMGKRLLEMYLRKKLSSDLQNGFAKSFPFSRDEILQKVYSQPSPNRFLASFSNWIYTRRKEKEIQAIITDSFSNFLEKQITKYSNYKQHHLNAVGSIAFYFKAELFQVMKENGMKAGKILESPIAELLKYHLHKF